MLPSGVWGVSVGVIGCCFEYVTKPNKKAIELYAILFKLILKSKNSKYDDE